MGQIEFAHLVRSKKRRSHLLCEFNFNFEVELPLIYTKIPFLGVECDVCHCVTAVSFDP